MSGYSRRPEFGPWSFADAEERRCAIDFTVEARPTSTSESIGVDEEFDAIPDRFFVDQFIDDIALQLFPPGGETRERRAVIVVVDPNAHREATVAALIQADPMRLGERQISDAACDWARDLALCLLRSGSVTHELAPIVAPIKGEERIVGFSLLPIRGTVLALPLAGAFQRVPRGAWTVPQRWNEDRAPVTRRWFRLDRSRLLSARLPRRLRFMRSEVAALTLLRSGPPMQFIMPNSSPQTERRLVFDFPLFRRTESVTVACVTRKSGWPTSVSRGQGLTGYYEVLRFLRFQRMLAELRSVAVTFLNEALVAVGAVTGVEAQLQMLHLPTPQQLERAIDELSAGSVASEDLIKRYAGY